MARVIAGSTYAMDFDQSSIGTWAYLTPTVENASYLAGDLRSLGVPGGVTEFFGQGITYDAQGLPAGGTITGYRESLDGALLIDVSGIAIPMAQLNDWVIRNASAEALQGVLAGADTITGSPYGDNLRGYAGDDTIQGGDGDDRLRGDAGNDVLDGGAGQDTAVYVGPAADYHVVVAPGITGIIPLDDFEFRQDGVDRLISVERLAFAGGTQTQDVGPVNFLPVSYAASYADLTAAFGTDAMAAFNHYLFLGAAEGRQTTFHGLEYIASYADLTAAFGANAEVGAAHYITSGRFEGRQASFHGLEYIASSADLIAAFGANAEAGAGHYITSGRFEGRQITFDGLEYIASHDDLIAAFGANAEAGAGHYITSGRLEGRQITFDGLEYIASNDDLMTAFGADADAGSTHYIRHGATEHRSTDGFDAAQYLANYADLQAAFGQDLEAAMRHWILSGHLEGRTDQPLIG